MLKKIPSYIIFLICMICCQSITVAQHDQKDSTSIDIVAVGDIMLGTNFPDNSSLPPKNGALLLSEADSLIKNASVSFGNLEGCFLDAGGKSKGSGPNVYNFRQPTSYATHLKSAGFDLLSIANNHIKDFGTLGIESTANTLMENRIAFAGTPQQPYCIIIRNGIKIGMIAFAPHDGCLNMLQTELAIKLVKEAKSKVDILMVSFHGGAEGSGATHVTRKREIFFNQDRGNVYAFAHAVVDAGADLVIGHGPHVPRAMEVYKSKLIAYSLGNFCTYGKFNLKGISGYAPMLVARVTKQGDIIEGQIISFLQKGEGGPVIDTQHHAAKMMATLSKQDIPESNLQFTDDGKFFLKRIH